MICQLAVPIAQLGDARIAHIPIYEVAAAAGLELFASDVAVDSYPAYPEDWTIPVLGSYPQNLLGLRAEVSMIPQLVDGDMVLMGRVLHKTRLLIDGIYIFRYRDDLLIKYLRLHPGRAPR